MRPIYKMDRIPRVGKLKGLLVKLLGKHVGKIVDDDCYLFRGKFYVL